MNNESLGQTVEKVLCDIYLIDAEPLKHRSDRRLEDLLLASLSDIKTNHKMPVLATWTGGRRGARGGHSKCPYDFINSNGERVSIKTNLKKTGAKICPPEVGQPGFETFRRYFEPTLGKAAFSSTKALKMEILRSFGSMLPIYLDHLFSCDYLVWIYQHNKKFEYEIINPGILKELKKHNRFSQRFYFTKTLETWNESNTVKVEIGGRIQSIGEFQFHSNRTHGSPKFRFILEHTFLFLKSLF